MGVQQAAAKWTRRRGRPRGRVRHGGRWISKWEEQEVKELSTLIFGYVQRSGGKLPNKIDAAFWEFCSSECFQGRFTARQVHEKSRSILRRFLQLSSGHAKSIKLSECDMFELWTQIMNMNPSPQVIDDSAGNSEGGMQPEQSSHPAANKPPSTQTPRHQAAGCTTGTKGMEGPSKGKTPTAGGDKGGVSAAGEACAREEEGKDTSTCSTENVLEESEYSHRREDCRTHTKHDVHAAAPVDVGESAHNMTLLQHFIAADLAITTKTLAEFVHSQRKRATA